MLNRICGLLSKGVASVNGPQVSSFTGNTYVCGGSVITIHGVDFLGPIESVSVDIDGIACTGIVRDSTTQLRATLPLGPAVGPPSVPLHVTTLYGTATLAGSFVWTHSPLTITSVTPATGPDAGSVTLGGTGFLDVVDVQSNGFSLATWAIVNDRTITATHEPEGPATPYTGDFTVINGSAAQASIAYHAT